jgi:WD40 repeat protein
MLDDDRILCGGSNDGIMKVVSIKKKGIIRTINVLKQVWSILVLNNGIFMSAGVDKNIRIFRSDTYECIRKINNVHTGDIMGFTEVNGNSIMSFACDSTFKIWVF